LRAAHEHRISLARSALRRPGFQPRREGFTVCGLSWLARGRVGHAVGVDPSQEKRDGMAELTNLESKLGEVIGLAMAAQAAAQTVTKLAQGEKERGVIEMLKVMKAEQRGKSVAETFDGKKSAILKEARETKQKAAQMMDTYLDQESDTLDGLEFMTMAEAGEVGHWEILARFNKRARNAEVKDLVSWGFPIQKRHLTEVRASSLQLVDKEDPNGSS
jgi:hypothetical protein